VVTLSHKGVPGLRRVRAVKVVHLPTPSEVGIGARGPAALRPRAGEYHTTPCTLCDSRCCCARICINVVDLARLVLILRVAPEDLLILDAEHETPLTLPATVAGRPVHMILRRIPTEGLELPACHMLARPGGALRCGVHGLRPGICRAYPFQFKTDRSDEVFSVGPATLCPRQWAVGPAVRRAVEQEILTWRRENDAAERIVGRWNAEHGAEDAVAFFAFAIERAARYLKLDPRPYHAARAVGTGLGERIW